MPQQQVKPNGTPKIVIGPSKSPTVFGLRAQGLFDALDEASDFAGSINIPGTRMAMQFAAELVNRENARGRTIRTQLPSALIASVRPLDPAPRFNAVMFDP